MMDAIVWAFPTSLSTDEDVPLYLSPTLSDVDIYERWGPTLTVELGVSHGILRLSRTDCIYVEAGRDGAALVRISGAWLHVSAALTGLAYVPDSDWSGSDTITYAASDNGFSGSGGVLWTNSSEGITVNAVNDAPRLSFVTWATVNEDEVVYIATNTVTDPDIGSNNLTATVTVADGRGGVTLGALDGLEFTTGDG
eukprot:815333_1